MIDELIRLTALKTLRVETCGEEVVASGLDADGAVKVVSVGVWGLLPIAGLLGIGALLPFAAITVAAASACRVRVVVDARHGTRVERRLAGFRRKTVPVACEPDRARATTDGWGDVLDPEAAVVDLDGHRVELAWAGRGDAPRVAKFVDDFNAAVKSSTGAARRRREGVYPNRRGDYRLRP